MTFTTMYQVKKVEEVGKLLMVVVQEVGEGHDISFLVGVNFQSPLIYHQVVPDSLLMK